MQPLNSLVKDVEDAIASGEDARRADTLRRLTGLFVDLSPQLGDAHVNVFDEVISRLAKEIEFRARVELAERLADVANAPVRTVRDLAFDQSIEVARPVLERSTRLDEKDLVEIAQQKGQEHLMALSVRRNLSEAVTDVLVVRGDQAVVRSVAGNQSAAFSDLGFNTLADRSLGDPRLKGILDNRNDISGERMAALVSAAKERARRGLMETTSETDEAIADALNAGADMVMTDGSSLVLLEDIVAARPRIEKLEAEGRLVEDEVQTMIREDRLADALMAMGKLASLPPEVMAHAYSAPHFDPILFVVRGIRFGWPTFKLLLTAKSGRNPPQALLKSAYAGYEALSIPTAQRVMRFVLAKQKMAAPR